MSVGAIANVCLEVLDWVKHSPKHIKDASVGNIVWGFSKPVKISVLAT